MPLIMAYASCTGQSRNTLYPYAAAVSSEEDLKRVVGYDYVTVLYKDGHRSAENFLRSNCLAMEIDNDHSDNPADWVTPESVLERFPDVTTAFHFSRNHLKEKNGKAPRPKFHVFFQMKEMTDPDAYRDLKKRVYACFPYFDSRALDAARFFFGTKDPQVIYHQGTITLNECLDMYYPDDEEDAFARLDMPGSRRSIPEGSRNATLSRYAARVLKRLGETEEARILFQARASDCNPPLDDKELESIWHSALGFFRRISAQPGYVAPDEFGSSPKEYRYRPVDETDVAEAKVLAETFGDTLRFSPATGYLVYNGKIWEENDSLARSLMHKLTEMQMEEAKKGMAAGENKMEKSKASVLLEEHSLKKAVGLMNVEQLKANMDYRDAKTYLGCAIHYRSSRAISAVLKEVEPLVFIQPQDLDADPYLLNTPAGEYDLRLGMAGALPHTAGHYITKITAVSPSDKGRDIWETALNTFFCGDRELMDYVQLVAGLMAVGKVFVEALIIAYGDGRNGKSTFWNTLAHVLGTYSGTIAADALTTECKRNVRPELAETKGKRMLIASELDEGARLSTSIVKQLCSTDSISAEKKFKAPFSFVPTHTTVLYTNYLPKVGTKDTGIWRRLIVIPFDARIEGKGDIKNYADYLFQNAGPAILAWIIEGARKIIAMNFRLQLPERVKKITDAYRETNDWFKHFLDECCEKGEELQERSSELYTAYRTYCMGSGEYVRSTTDFYSTLTGEGYKRIKTCTGMIIRGLALRRTAREDFLS